MGPLLHGIILMSFVLTGMAGCATKNISDRSKKRIAVFDIEAYVVSKPTDGGGAADMAPFFTSKLIQTLQENPSVTILEREKISTALEELSLGSSDLAQEETRLKIGRIIGASHMIFGGYQVIGGTMRIDLRMVEVASGTIVSVVARTGPASDTSIWLNTIGEMGKALLE